MALDGTAGYGMTGKELKIERKKMELSLSAMAKILDVNQRTIARWESLDKPVPSWVPVILNAFDSQHALLNSYRK